MSNWTVESFYISPVQPPEEKSLRKRTLPSRRWQRRKAEGERLEEEVRKWKSAKRWGGGWGGCNMRFILEGHIQLFAHCNAVFVAVVTAGKN